MKRRRKVKPWIGEIRRQRVATANYDATMKACEMSPLQFEALNAVARATRWLFDRGAACSEAVYQALEAAFYLGDTRNKRELHDARREIEALKERLVEREQEANELREAIVVREAKHREAITTLIATTLIGGRRTDLGLPASAPALLPDAAKDEFRYSTFRDQKNFLVTRSAPIGKLTPLSREVSSCPTIEAASAARRLMGL